MSTPISAPSRRSVVRAAAWTAPAVSIAVAAPAYANCSLAKVTGTLDWDATSGLIFSQGEGRRSASATYTKGTAAALTLTVSTEYVGSMQVGPESGANTNFDVQEQVGGLTLDGKKVSGLKLHQSNTLSAPRPINGKDADPNARRLDRGVYTFTFDRAVTNLSFYVTDIDSASGDFRDAVELSSGFGLPFKATAISGSGTSTDPFCTEHKNAAADNVTSGNGNIKVSYAGPIRSFTITYWNIANDFTTDTDQALFVSDLTFDYSPQLGCPK